MTTYHPTGTIRVLTPAEQSTMERRARAAASSKRAGTESDAGHRFLTAIVGVRGTLRAFFRQWAASQEHRAGF